MSRGLGKLQRKVIDALSNKPEKDIGSLLIEIVGSNPSISQQQSIWRAIRKLEKRGIVQTKKHRFTGVKYDWPWRIEKEYQIIDLDNGGWRTIKFSPRGGQSYYKVIRLVHCKIAEISQGTPQLNTYEAVEA